MQSRLFPLFSSLLLATSLFAGCGEESSPGPSTLGGSDMRTILPEIPATQSACAANPLDQIYVDTTNLADNQPIGPYTSVMRFMFRMNQDCGPMHFVMAGLGVGGSADSGRWYGTIDTPYKGVGGHFILGANTTDNVTRASFDGIDLVRVSITRAYIGKALNRPSDAPIEQGRWAAFTLAANTVGQPVGADFRLNLGELMVSRDADGQVFDLSKDPRVQAIGSGIKLIAAK